MSFYIICLFLYAVSMSDRNKSTYADAAWHIVSLIIMEYSRSFFWRTSATVELETLQFGLYLPYNVLQLSVTYVSNIGP
jgi:hypothetical protein